MPTLPRSIAVNILTEITEHGAYANIAIRNAFAKQTLDTRDRAFITEMVNETLRNLSYIDHIINQFSKTPVIKMKPFILSVLRISVCQIHFMSKVPHSAAVNEAVKLIDKRGFKQLTGFANGVLRNISRNPLNNTTDDIQLRLSYPDWLWESLVRWLGYENARLFCENSHVPPLTAIYTNTVKISPHALRIRLENEGVSCETGLLPECLRLKNTSDIAALPSFKEGLFFVIDEGAALAAKALRLEHGQTMVDICAAPGGKSFVAACVMQGTGHIQAYDVHEHRINLMRDSIKRLGFSNIAIFKQDASDIKTGPGFADAVLVDAPCSGLGIIRRRPDIKYNRKPQDIHALAEVQRKLLSAAARLVKPGGKLLYVTCTVAREENIENVKWFIQNEPFKTMPLTLQFDRGLYFIEDDCVQLLPSAYHDAFFMALFVKENAPLLMPETSGNGWSEYV